MPEKDIIRAENNWAEKEDVVNLYMKKWPRFAKEINEEIEKILAVVPIYSTRADKERLRVDMRFCRFAYGFKPDEFLCFKMEKKAMPERREYISDIERYRFSSAVNSWLDVDVFMDKYATYKTFKPYYMREAISISKPTHFSRFLEFVNKHPVFVKKRVDRWGGESVDMVNMTECGKTERECFHEIIGEGKCILEELVLQSETMAALNASSVNTVRCVTYNTKKGIVIPNDFIRTGHDGVFVDNGGRGGIIIGIDFETGRLATEGVTMRGEVFTAHPDTGIRFKGYQLPEWQQMLDLCMEMSAKVPSVKYISWDMAHTKKGWVVVEGNYAGRFIGQQAAFGRGMKSDIHEVMRIIDTYI